MDQVKIRAWWWKRQGLDGGLVGKPPAAVLEQAGWARSVAGAGPYLTLFARSGRSRDEVDAALARLEIHELPSARGCTYVVPASDFALALKVGQAFNEADRKTGLKLGVTGAEIEKLCAAVLDALKKGPLDPEQLREAVAGAARSLGPEGVKKGMSTTLPLALGPLQSSGEIRRVPVNGRLDQQRYRYALWRPNPLARFKLSAEEAYTELARRFFRWIGPATPSEFQWFSGLGVKAAKAALEPLGLARLAEGDERLMFPEDLETLRSFAILRKPQFAVVSSLDSIAVLRRDVEALIEPADRGLKLMSGGLTDLPNHAILDRGRLAGLWDYDPDSQSIVWASFIPKTKELYDAVSRTEDFVRTQLGDARSFSLDTPKSRAPRLQALRKAAEA